MISLFGKLLGFNFWGGLPLSFFFFFGGGGWWGAFKGSRVLGSILGFRPCFKCFRFRGLGFKVLGLECWRI